jgi:hypothetical protein
VQDATRGRALANSVRARLEELLAGRPDLAVVPRDELAATAKKARLGQPWRRPRVLAALQTAARLDAALLIDIERGQTDRRSTGGVTRKETANQTSLYVIRTRVRVAGSDDVVDWRRSLPVTLAGGDVVMDWTPDEADLWLARVRKTLPEPATPEPPPTTAEPPPAPVADDGFAAALAAMEAAPAVANALPAVLETVKVSGAVHTEVFVHRDQFAALADANVDPGPGRHEIELLGRLAIGDGPLRGVGAFVLRQDFADPTRARVEIDELVISASAGGFDLQAGRLYTSWGAANLYNPADVVNRVDARDLIDIEKRAAPMVVVGYGLGPLYMEALWLPVPEIHDLPPVDAIAPDGTLVSNNRWVQGAVPTTSATSSATALPPVPLRFFVAKDQNPAPTLDRTGAALRARLSLLGADVSVGWLSTTSRYPTLRPTITPARPLPLSVRVDVVPEHPREHAFVVDAEWTSGGLRLAGEALAVVTHDLVDNGVLDDADLLDPYGVAVGGFDWRFGVWDEQHLHLFVEGTIARSFGTDGDEAFGIEARTLAPAALLGRLAWEFDDDASVEIGAVWNVDPLVQAAVAGTAPVVDDLDDLAAAVRGRVLVAERVRVVVGVVGLFGQPDQPFGRFADNGRAEALLEVPF